MSIWLSKPDAHGKRSIYFAEIPYQLLIAAFGVVAFVVLPRYLGRPDVLALGSLVLMAAGFAMYLTSKTSLFVKGVWVSWGPGRMTRPFRVLYFIGIVLMALATVMLALSLRGT